MKTILLHVKNLILKQSLELALRKANDFKIDVEQSNDYNNIVEKMKKNDYDIIFIDIARTYLYDFETRKKLILEIRKLNLKTKIVVFCDSNSEPEKASKVKELKALNLIDAFFYESVDDKYIIAVLESL